MRKSIKVRERKLGREHAYGLAWKEERLAEIDPRLSERDRLSTLVHELIHLVCPELIEEEVARRSDEMWEVLWKDGWRGTR